jgi:outer membrane protein TolC
MKVSAISITEKILGQSATLIFLGTALLAISPIKAQVNGTLPLDTLTIDSVIQAVLENNDRAAAARIMEKAAYEEIGPAGAWDDPMLMLGVQNLPTSWKFDEDPMTMKMVGLRQRIPYAGEKGMQGKAARAAADASREETRTTVLDLVTAAKLAYFNLYYQQQALEFVTVQREIQQDILASVTARLRTDQASQADVAAAQADLWRLKADIISFEQDIVAAQNELEALMGMEPGAEFPPLAAPEFATLDQRSETWLAATENYPPLRQLKYQAENYRLSAAASRRMRWPMLEVGGSYGFRDDIPPAPGTHTPVMEADDMVTFQADLSIPIFSWGKQAGMARSMEAMRRGTEFEYAQVLRKIRADISTLHARARRLAESSSLYRDRIVPADQDAYRSAFASFVASQIPFTSLQTYALNIYRDRLMSNQLAFELARTLAEAERYITNPEVFSSR